MCSCEGVSSVRPAIFFSYDVRDTTLRSRKQEMRAITLHQPWASMIAMGYKPTETRGWPRPSPWWEVE